MDFICVLSWGECYIGGYKISLSVGNPPPSVFPPALKLPRLRRVWERCLLVANGEVRFRSPSMRLLPLVELNVYLLSAIPSYSQSWWICILTLLKLLISTYLLYIIILPFLLSDLLGKCLLISEMMCMDKENRFLDASPSSSVFIRLNHFVRFSVMR